MHANFHRFERAERNISNELSRSTSGEIEPGLVAVGGILASKVRVELLEVLVSSVFESTLGLSTQQRTSHQQEIYRMHLGFLEVLTE